ncbi:MAG: ArnT family glycosyltransferase [Phycisphaerae bacterium]
MSTSRAAFRRTHRTSSQRVWVRATYAFIVIWFFGMAPLEFWGLPGRSADGTLFGGGPPWPAETYAIEETLAERKARDGGADTDLDPVSAGDAAVSLTASPADRAAILRRYRLFSRQPDEMITFMALQRMNPGARDFDPRLYQYGGAYIYLVGAAVTLASVTGYTSIGGDVSRFLEDPTLFAHFYVVSRFLTLAFGALLLAMVGKLAARLVNAPARFVVVVSLALTPVFITTVTEAKPHLPSAALLVTAVWFACEYARSGRSTHAYIAGVCAGLAFSFVLTGLAAFCCFLPIFFGVIQTREDKLARVRLQRTPLVGAMLIGLGIYGLTNFYFLYNLLFHRALITGNVANSTAMYVLPAQHPLSGAIRVVVLLHECVGLLTPTIGLFGLVVLCYRKPRSGAIVVAPAIAFLAAAIFLAHGKPAEFGRFLLVPALALVLGATQLFCGFWRTHAWLAAAGVGQFLIASGTVSYLRSIYLDAKAVHESRTTAARWIEENISLEHTIGLLQEPAPYAVPPIDFTRRQIVLLPPVAPEQIDVTDLPEWLVFTADNAAMQRAAWWQTHYRLERVFPSSPATNQITWANKPVYLYSQQ